MAKCSLSQIACKPEPFEPSKEKITILRQSELKKWVMATLDPPHGKYPDFSEKYIKWKQFPQVLATNALY